MTGAKPGAPPLNEWQTETLKNQAALVELQREQVDATNALAGHAESIAQSLAEIANLLDRLVLQGGKL